MTTLTDSGRRFTETEDAAPLAFFTVVGVCLVALNLSTFLYHASASPVFNVITNTISLALIGYSIHAVLRSPSRAGPDIMFLVLACAVAGTSMLLNLTVASPIDTLKYLSIYVFYAAGRAWGQQSSAAETRFMCALALMPLAFLALGSSKVYPPGFAYLPNENTAVLFFSAILFAMSMRLGTAVILLQFVNAALMNKLGAAVATAIAIGLWVLFPLRRDSILGLLGVVALAVVAHLFGAFDRVATAIDNMALILSLEPATIAHMSYKDLVELTGTTDLSAFFRIIHWSNIWDLYWHNGLSTLLFGYGAGQTSFLAHAPLPPHNDYLRILAEYGPLNLVIFACFLAHIVVNLTMASRVLFIVLMIYFFSENLLDNFTSMALYFAYAGRMTAWMPVEDRTLRICGRLRDRLAGPLKGAGQAGPAPS